MAEVERRPFYLRMFVCEHFLFCVIFSTEQRVYVAKIVAVYRVVSSFDLFVLGVGRCSLSGESPRKASLGIIIYDRPDRKA